MIPLLSSFYFGSVEHYRLLARHQKVIIDTGEHYERQSYRTRTAIIGPNGKQDLCIPVEHGHGRKMPMREVRLSYAEAWPAQHVHAIRSAYGQTPWFIHYIDEIEAVVMKPYERLVDLQLATIGLGMKWLGLRTELTISTSYVEMSGEWPEVNGPPVDLRQSLSTSHRSPPTLHLDLRNTFQPKRPLPMEVTPAPPYTQVFADRHGFIPRMSLIDLVCNTGPQARHSLMA